MDHFQDSVYRLVTVGELSGIKGSRQNGLLIIWLLTVTIFQSFSCA
jgi:hypothetical protein